MCALKNIWFQHTTKATIEKCPSGFLTDRNLGKFSTNLIQKIINNMFVTPDMCMCDLSVDNMYMILIIMILITENEGWVAATYPVAPKLTLVDIAVVDVVVPLDAVQVSCSADHHANRRCREVEEVVD
jgi:hypothetical protein